MEGNLLRSMLTSAILSCMAFGAAASSTVLTPQTQVVPDGEDFQLKCKSVNVQTDGSEYRSQLYKVGENGNPMPVSADLTHPCNTRYTLRGDQTRPRLFITTEFTLTASAQTAGRYGCLPVRANASMPSTIPDKIRNFEVTVRVCQEPDLQLDHSGSDPVLVQAREQCGYAGEMTWLINGQRAPREFTREAKSSPAIERADDTLELHSTGCGIGEGSSCDVIAIFTYISADRLSSVNRTLEIPDCCISSTVQPGETTSETAPVTFPPHPLDVIGNHRRLESDKLALEKEVLGLQKEVLELKKTALPLQIKFLKRLSREQNTGRAMEKVAGI